MILHIVTTACWTLVAFGQDQDQACLLQNKGAQKFDKNEADSEDVVHASHLDALQEESNSQFHDWFAKFSQNPMGAVNDFSSLPEEQRKHLMSDFSKVPSDVLKTKLDALPEASQQKIALALRRSPLASLLQSDSGKLAAALKDQASEFEESVTSKKDGGGYDGGWSPTRRRVSVTPTRRRYGGGGYDGGGHDDGGYGHADGGGYDGGGYDGGGGVGYAPPRRRYYVTPTRRRYSVAPTRRRYGGGGGHDGGGHDGGGYGGGGSHDGGGYDGGGD